MNEAPKTNTIYGCLIRKSLVFGRHEKSTHIALFNGWKEYRMILRTELKRELMLQNVDAKRARLFLYVFPFLEIGFGSAFAFCLNAIPYLFMNGLGLSGQFTSFLVLMMIIIAFFSSFISSVVIERSSFKKSRYYPWFIIGPLLSALPLSALFAFSINGIRTQWLIITMSALFAFFAPIILCSKGALFSQVFFFTDERVNVILPVKSLRLISVFCFTLLMPYLLKYFGGDADIALAYVRVAQFIGCLSMISCLLAALLVRGSYVERRTKEKEEAARKRKYKKIPLKMTLKLCLANHVFVSLFVFNAAHKAIFFLPPLVISYFFMFAFCDVSLTVRYLSLSFYLPLLLGQLTAKKWINLFKELKKILVVMSLFSLALHLTGLISRHESLLLFFISSGMISFCMGIMEIITPVFFAGGADYSAWKVGRRMDALPMTVYTSSVIAGFGIVVAVIIVFFSGMGIDFVSRTPAPYMENAIETLKTIFAQKITDSFSIRIRNVLIWHANVFGVFSLLSLRFWMHLTTNRIEMIQDNLAQGKTIRESKSKP